MMYFFIFLTIYHLFIIIIFLLYNIVSKIWAPSVAQWYRIHLTMQETWIQTLIWNDPLEKEMATHSCILAWKSPWTEEPAML